MGPDLELRCFFTQTLSLAIVMIVDCGKQNNTKQQVGGKLGPVAKTSNAGHVKPFKGDDLDRLHADAEPRWPIARVRGDFPHYGVIKGAAAEPARSLILAPLQWS